MRVDLENVDGTLYLVARQHANGERLFYFENGKFVKTNRIPVFEDGYYFYSECAGLYSKYADTGCTDDPYAGKTCIKIISPGGFEKVFEAGNVDFSKLEREGYSLEFAIRNTDPETVINFLVSCRLGHASPTYVFGYHGDMGKHDGEWEVFTIPLSDFECWFNDDGEKHWDSIRGVRVSGDVVNSVVYIDEIRVRKVLP